MPLNAVLFDMDGVIVNTEPLHRKAYFKMFDEVGIDVDDHLYNSFTGASTKKVCQKLIDHFSLENEVDELINTKRKHFKDYFDNDPDFDLIPGVLDLIKNYFENDVKLVLASSASRNTINWVFDKFDLNPYFIGKISGAELKESKPHPEIFQLAAKMANEPTENCMVIEDSTNGIEASHQANIFCTAYKSPFTEEQNYEKANHLISDFSDIWYDKIKSHFD